MNLVFVIDVMIKQEDKYADEMVLDVLDKKYRLCENETEALIYL